MYFATKDLLWGAHDFSQSVFLSFLFRNVVNFPFPREFLFYFKGSPEPSALSFNLSQSHSGYIYETCAGLLFLALLPVGLKEPMSPLINSFTLQNKVPVSKLHPENDPTSMQTHEPQPRILWHRTKSY